MTMTMYDIITILVEDFRKIKYPTLEFKFQHDAKKFQKWAESDEYQEVIAKHTQDMLDYKAAKDKLHADFKTELLKFLGIQDHPKADMLYNFAVEYAPYACCGEGSASDDMYGFLPIADTAEDLVKLL